MSLGPSYLIRLSSGPGGERFAPFARRMETSVKSDCLSKPKHFSATELLLGPGVMAGRDVYLVD